MYTAADREQEIQSSFDKLKELDARLDRQLQGMEGRSADKRLSLKRIAACLFVLLLLLILPFFILVRTSVFLFAHYALNGWISLGAGAGATVLLLTTYAAAINYLVRDSMSVHRYIRRGIGVLVLVFCTYGLVYLSGLNAKSPEVASYYRSLHPIIRVATSTTILFSSDLVITDMQRVPDDYRLMGLPGRQRSYHYLQETGYVHALDLRTKGRAEWKNVLVEALFKAMGMTTLRHTGTADHLHVALPLPG